MTSYEDRISVHTPEGVVLETTLAGLGSRFHAAFVDGMIQGLLLIAVVVAAFAAGDMAAMVTILILGLFVVMLGYDLLFELRWSGRTPGKRSAGIRVVRAGGGPVGFREVAIRTVLRLVDMLPFSYMVGAVTVLVDRQNRRLGDIAAGTLVVRERGEVVKGQSAVPRLSSTARAELDTWDVSLVTADEVATVRRFLERRESLLAGARARLADDLAERLMSKVAGPRGRVDPELFLVQVLEAKAARARAASPAAGPTPPTAPGPDGPTGRFG